MKRFSILNFDSDLFILIKSRVKWIFFFIIKVSLLLGFINRITLTLIYIVQKRAIQLS